MTLIVRDATRDDATAISHVRVDTWRAAYAGLVAQELLDGMDALREGERRRERWDELHVDTRGGELIAEVDGVTAGWAALGVSIDDDRPRDGQLYAIYARPEFWSRGVGRALILTAEQRLRAAGFRKAHLWVLDGNERAAAFYERHGWREDGAVMTDERRSPGGEAHTLFERRRVRDLRERIPST